mgnify:CR=1 FL=1
MDSRLRRFPPDRVSAVPYGQTVDNAMRCPPLAHRSAAAHKLHSAQANRYKIRESQNQNPGTGLSLFQPGGCPNDRDHRSFSTLPILATVHSEQLSLLADADFMGEECVLLATQQADGKFAVRALLRKNAAVNAAFQSLYSEQCEKQKQQEKELLAANEADGAMKAAA